MRLNCAALLLLPGLLLRGDPAFDAAAARCRLKLFREAEALLRMSALAESLAGWTLHGRILAGLGEKRQALAALERALLLDPGHPPALRLQGRVLLALGRPVQAQAVASALLAIVPDDRQGLALATRAACGTGRYGEAFNLCRRLLAVDPGGWHCYLMAGILEKLARPGEALPWYRRAFQQGVCPRRGTRLVLARCSWKTALALKQAGRIREAASWFTLLARDFGTTPYGKRAAEQLAALIRLQQWESKKK